MKTLTSASAAALLATAIALPAAAGDEYGDEAMKMKAKAEMSADMDNDDLFDSIDMDRDARIDFTEFSTYAEREYGWSAADSAKEYVRLSDEDGIITDRTFAGVNALKLPHTHLDGTPNHSMARIGNVALDRNDRTAVMSRTITSDTSTLRPAYSYGTFVDYDMNQDGRVDFTEYSTYRTKAGITTTQSAQEFIRFTDGDSYFEEDDFTIAVSSDVLNRPYYKQTLRGAALERYDDPANNIVFDATEYDARIETDLDVDYDDDNVAIEMSNGLNNR